MILNYGYCGDGEKKIRKFLEDIDKIPYENFEWEKKIMDFFGNELCVPYVIEFTGKEETKTIDGLKEIFSNTFNSIVHIDTDELYASLNKIYESTKNGIEIKEYAEFFYKLQTIYRSFSMKKIDYEDSSFKNFKIGMKTRSFERTMSDGKRFFFHVYFIIPDMSLEYPLEKWAEEAKEKLVNRAKGLNKQIKVKKREPIGPKLRHEVFKRDEYKCLECGKGKHETTLHIDHIVPVSQNGTDELNNLQTLCEKCNLAKSNRCWKGGPQDT